MTSTSAKKRILVVEDGDAERESLARFLRLEGFDVCTARNPQEALDLSDPVDLVLSDLRMGKQTGIDLLRQWRLDRAWTPFILLTAYGDVDSAVTAMKLGALDFLTKPIDPVKLLELLHATLNPTPALLVLEGIVGDSAPMRRVCEQTLRVARTKSTVLILGESGTGKELIAEALHHHGPCRDFPFVVINMAALPESLVESELFGHVKGAFTGASTDRIGKIQAADLGTLFIDEIGDYPLHLQPKLLRVLENHVITPVGSNENRQVEVRIIAATSRPLHRMVEEGTFREDLFYRLNVVTIQLPPLRDRIEDIPILTRYFLDQFHKKTGLGPWEPAPDLLERLQAFSWPGNVRQLRNLLESLCVMAEDRILQASQLPPEMRSSEAEGSSSRWEMLKRSAIQDALDKFKGNRTRAAEFLGISVRTLQRKLRDRDLQE